MQSGIAHTSALFAIAILLSAIGCVPGDSDLRTASFAIRSDGPKSLDPVRGSTVYENRCASQVFETLLQYKYLVRPFELEPLLLEEMPTVSDDGLTYHFKLKKDVFFQDDPCFPDGKGREMVASDVIYSWKRIADESQDSKVGWIFEDTILGWEDFRNEQNKAAEFDYNAPLEGLHVIDDHEFTVTLANPVSRFLWTLAMFQTSVVPREAVDKYGDRLGLHPVGTGPFILREEDWRQGQSMVFRRNPNYHECYYPDEHMPEDEKHGFHEPAGRRLPFLDAIEVAFEPQDQPLWLNFKSGKYDYSQVPSEYFDESLIRRTQDLRASWKRKGMSTYSVALLDFIFIGFNMYDDVVGGYTIERKKLRQAICLALDWDERNEVFYNGLNIVYDGPIPPGMAGYPEGGHADVSYRGANLQKAKKLLEEAGYPDGEGLPVLDYYVARGRNNQEQSEMLQQHLSKINIDVNVHLVDFSTLIKTVDDKKAQFFSFAWGSDYPDAENNLALFFGPNEAPKPNHFNYKNEEYDRLYRTIFEMQPSEERTAIMEKMRDIVLEDCPYAGSMARTRFYITRSRMKYFKPVETFENWFKYVDVVRD